MIPELRQQFNRQWKPELYAELLRRLDEAAGTHVEFRCSETPVFLPRPLVETMVRYGYELYYQLASNPEYTAASDGAIPPQFRAPNENPDPLFLQADFGLVENEAGLLEPKLVEIQGFPSIYAFQAEMARVYDQTYRLRETLDSTLTTFLDGMDEAGFVRLLRQVIVGPHAPEEVVLLEIDPYGQKTLADFLATQRLLGIRIANITDVRKNGNKLSLDGIPIKRIYNRVIVDELVRKEVPLSFDFRDDLDVEWAGHPNWFFRISKFSLPWFRHESVPETTFLHEVRDLPPDLENYVLKPLYSFAGLGVKIAPSREEIESIPRSQRSEYVLQRRMNFVPTIATPAGMTKIEIRIMYIRDVNRLVPVTTVVRTGRGKMMGVDFNKDLDWVGASAGFQMAS